MRRQCLGLVLAAAMVTGLAACGGGSSSNTTAAAAETTASSSDKAQEDTAASGGESSESAGTAENYLTFKVGTNHNTDSFFYKGLSEFKKIIEEKTNGAVQVQVFADEALGTEGEMAEGVAMGTVDACLIGSSSVAKLDSNFNVFSLPYLFNDNDHVDAVFAGAPGQRFKDSIWNNNHVKVLDYWDSGFRYYSNSKREINSPEDMKGLLIRIPDNPIQAAIAEALGASTSTLGYKEVYLACSNGTVDGQEGPIFAFVEDNFYDVQKYMVLDGHVYTGMGLMMNGNVWEKLKPEDQEIVQQAAVDAGLVEKQGIRDSQAEQIEFLKSKGMVINENPDKQAWRDATASVYDKFKDTYGEDLIDQIKNFQY